MRITFKNPDNPEFVGTVAIPWLGVMVRPIQTFRIVRSMRRIVRMPEEQAERTMHQLADQFEARGMQVTREEIRHDGTEEVV